MNLRIVYPESVSTFNIELQEFSLPALQSELRSLTGLEPQSQILISYGGHSLKELTHLPSEPVFLFSKDLAFKESLELDFQAKPFQNELEEPCPGEERGFLILERKLHQIALKASSLKNYAESWINQRNAAQNQLSIFTEAIDLLRKFYSNYLKYQVDSFNDLYCKFGEHNEKVSEELTGFDPALKRLSEISLHPSLVDINRSVLAEVFDISQLVKWKEQFVVERKQLQQKFEGVKKGMANVPDQIGSENLELFVIPSMKDLEEALEPLEEVIETYRIYRELCYECLYEANASAAEDIHEIDWTSKSIICKTLVEEAQKLIENSEKEIKLVVEVRKKSAAAFLTNTKKLTDKSIKIRKTVKSEVNMLFSLFKRSQNKLEILKVPKLLPEAYEAALSEIGRRRKFVEKAIQLENNLNLVAEEEIQIRVEFLEKYKHILPSSFIPELAAYPCIRPVYFENEADLKLPILEEIPEPPIFSEKETEINSLKQKIESLLEENEKYENDLKKQEMIISDASEALDDITSNVKKLERELSERNLKLEAESDKIERMRSLESKVKKLEEELESWKSVLPSNISSVGELSDVLASLASEKSSMISFTSFEIGSLALFFPTDDDKFEAFNYECPNHFLNLDCLSPFTLENLEGEPYIIGLITDKKIISSSTLLTIQEIYQ